jgi:hypothetical protein
MKIPKKVYIILTVSLLVIGTGILLYLKPATGEISLRQTSSVTKENPKEEVATTEQTPAADPERVITPEVKTAPEPEPVKEDVPTQVKGYFINANQSESLDANVQWDCFNKIINETVGYTTYDDAVARIAAIKATGNSYCGAYQHYVYTGPPYNGTKKDYHNPAHKPVMDSWLWPSLAQ